MKMFLFSVVVKKSLTSCFQLLSAVFSCIQLFGNALQLSAESSSPLLFLEAGSPSTVEFSPTVAAPAGWSKTSSASAAVCSWTFPAGAASKASCSMITPAATSRESSVTLGSLLLIFGACLSAHMRDFILDFSSTFGKNELYASCHLEQQSRTTKEARYFVSSELETM
jgi:hypothetical protein